MVGHCFLARLIKSAVGIMIGSEIWINYYVNKHGDLTFDGSCVELSHGCASISSFEEGRVPWPLFPRTNDCNTDRMTCMIIDGFIALFQLTNYYLL